MREYKNVAAVSTHPLSIVALRTRYLQFYFSKITVLILNEAPVLS